MDFTRSEGLGGFSLAGDYSEAFYVHVFQMVAEGYKRLDPCRYSENEEEEITGALTEAIQEFLEDDGSPDWAAAYSVVEDCPLPQPGRMGRKRRRLDFTFIRSQRGERPKFVFEAKRLNKNTRLAKHYFGQDGLGRFLSGTYPAYNDRAGMLGYVQTGSEPTWAERLSNHLAENHDALVVEDSPGWQTSVVTEALPHTYLSRHRATASGTPLAVYHVLLRFY